MIEKYGIYVHIPFCKARCGYCAFSSCTDFNLQGNYFSAICNEINSTAIPAGARVTTMYWGGGTPSSVDVSYLQQLYRAISQKFDLSGLVEFTVECNPESATAEMLSFLHSIGVTRLSFGLQSANDATLKKIGRIHTYDDFLQALDNARKIGFDNINADVILGLPEDREEFYRTVSEVVQLPLTHVSLYALEIHEGTPIATLCEPYAFTDDELADMYDYAMDVFHKNGFYRYEVSNFAKADRECRHNLIYWTEGRYFGFGASASGFVGDLRYTNIYAPHRYAKSGGVNCREASENISLDEQAYEYVMLGLRLARGIDLSEFRKRFSIDFFDRFPMANRLIADGFLQVVDGRLIVAPDKFYVLNSILAELL